jgi:hypothetical protein
LGKEKSVLQKMSLKKQMPATIKLSFWLPSPYSQQPRSALHEDSPGAILNEDCMLSPLFLSVTIYLL